MATPRLHITCSNTHYTANYLQGSDILSEHSQYTVVVDTLDIIPLQQGLGQIVVLDFVAADNASRRLNATLLAIEDKGVIGANTHAAASLKRRYQLTLGSRLPLLNQTQHSRVFVDTPLTDLLSVLLAGAGYHHAQLSFHVATPLPVLAQCVQAMETDHAFFNRLLRQHGLFYWLDSVGSDTRLVISDTNQSSPYLERGLLVVHHSSGFNANVAPSQRVNDVATQGFVGFTQCQLASQMRTGLATATTNAYRLTGESLAAHNFAQPVSACHAQAEVVAKNQSLALNRFEHIITLTGNVPDIFAGCSFSLHDDSSLNASGDYLCVSVEHYCQQPSDETSQDGLSHYYCVVTAIPRGQPFKLPYEDFAPLPAVFSAKVESISATPTLTERGEYFAKTGYDHTANMPLTSTQPLRKLVHYACANQPQATGWHFPLANDTHVLLGCLNNDPSQAYLIGFDMNEAQPSIVNSHNHYHNRILSRSGHELRFDDNANIPTIILHTLGSNNYLELNANTCGQHYIQWLSRLGTISFYSAKDLAFENTEGDITVSVGGYQSLDAKDGINITVDADSISKQDTLNIQSATQHQQQAKAISLAANDISLLTGRSINARAANDIAWRGGGDITISAPKGSTLINVEGNIRIEGTGKGDITLFNQHGIITLDSNGNVELIGNEVLTLNGQTITFDGEVSYELGSPIKAIEPTTQAPPSIARVGDLGLGLAATLTAASQTIALAYTYQDGEPVQGAPYTLHLADGTLIKGHLDNRGKATVTGVPAGQYTVQYGEDTRQYQPMEHTTPNPLYGKITPQAAIAMVERGDTGLLTDAADIAASAGDWLWGTLQGDFNENPSTSQIVVGTLISMIPVIDQVMDCRDICANAMLLTDDDNANDTNGWIALSLTGIGFIPVFGSAIKGVGKIVVKQTKEALSPALAVLRKLGKGDPVQYLRQIDWHDLTQQATALIKAKIVALRDALLDITDSWFIQSTISKDAIASLKKKADRLTQILPNVEQGIKEGVQHLKARLNKALDEYTGEVPHVGTTNVPKKVKANELDAPKGNEFKGAQPSKAVTTSRRTPDDFTEFKSMNHKKAAAGEYNAHQLMTEKGYTPVGKPGGDYKPGETGIDGIYNHPNPPPDYVITEAKYNNARLGKTKDGKQMSNEWITDKRLEKAGLSKSQRDEILDALEDNDGTVQKLLIRNKPDGSLVIKELGSDAKIISKPLGL